MATQKPRDIKIRTEAEAGVGVSKSNQSNQCNPIPAVIDRQVNNLI